MQISEEQAVAFRARRHLLADGGAESAPEVARTIVGVQAQVVSPALWSIAVRMEEPATADELADELTSGEHLVRSWGQRDTLHIYDARAHWPKVVSCIAEWPIGARGGEQMPLRAIEEAAQRIQELNRPVTRSDLFDLIPEDFLEYMASRTGPGMPAKRGAAGRFIWALGRAGVLSTHTRDGREQSYIPRARRFPDMEWDPPAPRDAGRELIRDYLRANAPATVHDVAHFLGTRICDARELLATMEDELLEVACEGREDLMVMKQDQASLQVDPPDEWPARLLPKFDTMLMSHSDKTWTVPNEDERPAIWGKGAQVYATVLHRGRLIATWKHKALKKSVKIDVTPLSGWTEDAMPGIEADAERFAEHLGVPMARLRIV